MKRGFTLVEMLLSVAILSLVAGIGIPVYMQFQVRNELDITTGNVVASLRRASFMAQGQKEDSMWSVKVAPGAVTIYKGIQYGSRDTTFDEQIDIPASITPNGITDVTFARMTGAPFSLPVTPIVLTSENGEAKTITINAKGIISY